MSSHQDKVALVTGADRGIGKAVSLRLAQAGARLVLHSNDRAGLAAVRSEIEASGGDVMTAVHDVADGPAVNAAVVDAIERHGRIDYLLNVAGVAYFGGLLQCTEEEWDETMRVNVKGYFLMTKAVLPHMKAAGSGVIVNMSSIWGRRGAPTMLAYSTSKFAIEGFTRGLIEEAAPYGVKVSSLVLDKVDTAFRDRMTKYVDYSPEQRARMLMADDVADSVMWVLDSSPRSLPASIELAAWQWR